MRRKAFQICAMLAALALAAPAVAEEPVDMLEVDHRLYELGYRDSACNGVLDEVTVNALRNFQLANGLEISGEPDATTVARLFSDAALSQAQYLSDFSQQYAQMAALGEGDYGEGVARLQRALGTLGYFSGESDGAFGEETAAAVCRFRLANGLAADTGVADGGVYLRLYGGGALSWEDFLRSLCASAGDSGAGVRTVQNWLRRKGYFQGACTGRYGEDTQQAVRRLQGASDLEPSGDVDVETARALLDGAAELMLGGQSVRRGDGGQAAEEVCRKLAGLGYPAHARFNMQTELALMEFQLINDLAVTGEADAQTRAALDAQDAQRRDDYEAAPLVVSGDEALPGRIARQATALLGQLSELDSDFDFVKYVCMKCGVSLTERAQLRGEPMEQGEPAEAGDVLGLELGGRELMGVAASEQALIYRADSGYIVMSYLEALEPERVIRYVPAEAEP